MTFYSNANICHLLKGSISFQRNAKRFLLITTCSFVTIGSKQGQGFHYFPSNYYRSSKRPFGFGNDYFCRPYYKDIEDSSLQKFGNIDAVPSKVAGKYDSFVTELASTCKPDPVESAERAVSFLAQRKKTWKRLKPLVNLACSVKGSKSIGSIVDIGCDHGLLSLALACTKCFDKVIGVDVSSTALENGAHKFHYKILDSMEMERESKSLDPLSSNNDKQENIFPVEFRTGDGLNILKVGEADGICIAGMGVGTMLDVLLREANDKGLGFEKKHTMSQLDHLGSQMLILQPTNSRPRNLMRLYKTLQELGWELVDEEIDYISSRWYITSAFEKKDIGNNSMKKGLPLRMPGDAMISSKADLFKKQNHEYNRYVDHHISWIKMELEQKKESIDENDIEWLHSNQKLQ
mmetsp:Transcript_6907/g.9931  ORF Transcript_6907/g.9931 Transcript_6907/m.9931 type:complete len:406 (-) Transcript_6907:237-1454(-)